MTKETYMTITRPFRENPKMARGIHIANRMCTSIMYAAYPLLLIYMFRQQEAALVRAVLVPFISFVVLSVFRYLVNRKRPYEVFEMPPVIKKDTRGKSFPSRHVFSAMMIAQTFLFLSPWNWLGLLFTAVALLLAAVRVCSGVHFISDVIAGAAFAVAAALTGYVLL